jgi:lipopolysaccharide/colanic/teichoic acid biosynthesis glycosyltransferase
MIASELKPKTATRTKVCFVATVEMAVEVHLLEHIKAMSERSDVMVVVNTADPRFARILGDGVAIMPVAIPRRVRLWRDGLALGRLIQILRRERCDVVHSIMPKSGLLAMIAGFVAGVPVRVHTFTGQVWVTRTGLRRWLLRQLDRVLAGFATDILVDSPSQRDFLVDERIVSARKARVLANGSIQGVDTKRMRPDPVARSEIRRRLGIPAEDVVFLFLGRMTRDKGLLDLAKAFTECSRWRDDLHLAFVGPDEEGMRAKIMDAANGSADRIHFEGYTRIPEKFMAAADVFCLPSYREGFGTVLIEAAAAGVPAIATRIYGIVDAVDDGHTGYLYEPGDVKALAARMVEFSRDPELREAMGRAARERVIRRFSQETVVAAMLEFYEKIFVSEPEAEPVDPVKRAFDVVLAVAASLILALPMLAIAVLIRLSSDGPLLYWSDRVGRGNTLFRMPKFRTMKVGAPAVATHLLTESDRWITPLGTFLRRTSLDELPQLYNILRGELSFVGPRPALFNQEDLIALRASKGVDALVPGLTGWAQINGRDELSIPEKVSFDEEYLQNRSLGFDLRILCLTFFKVVRAEGVEH